MIRSIPLSAPSRVHPAGDDGSVIMKSADHYEADITEHGTDAAR